MSALVLGVEVVVWVAAFCGVVILGLLVVRVPAVQGVLKKITVKPVS